MLGQTNPPGPTNWNRLVGLTWRHAFMKWWDPLRFVTRVGHQYGDIASYLLFTKRAYLINSPELIHEVLVGKKSSFIKQPRQMRVMRQCFGESLLVSEGEHWLRQRRLIQKAFHPRHFSHLADVTVDLSHKLLAGWVADSPFNIAHAMSDLTMAISIKSMFDLEPGDDARRLGQGVRLLSAAFIREIHSVINLPDWLPTTSKFSKRWAISTLREYVDQAITERRGSLEDRDDLLSMLLRSVDDEGDGKGMSDTLARDEAITMLVAGNHTSSASLTWFWYLVSQNPDVLDRLIDEADEVLGQRPATLEDVERLTFTAMAIKEALRIYPPAWALFAREAAEDVSLQGYRIKRGAWIFIYPWLTHRDARFFVEPLKYDPDRWSPERVGEIKPNAYIPFGLGPHVCIGNRLSMMQLSLIVATICQQYRLQPVAGQAPVTPEAHVAIRPTGGYLMRAHARERHTTPAGTFT